MHWAWQDKRLYFCSTHSRFTRRSSCWKGTVAARYADSFSWRYRYSALDPVKNTLQNGTVINATDYYFIQDIISVVHAVPAIRFRLGNTVLSASGKCHLLPDDSGIQKESHSKISVLPDLYHPGENATYLRLETGLHMILLPSSWNTHSLSAVLPTSIFPCSICWKMHLLTESSDLIFSPSFSLKITS